MAWSAHCWASRPHRSSRPCSCISAIARASAPPPASRRAPPRPTRYRRAMRWFAVDAEVAVLAGAGCRKKSDAERVADRFVDLYYVEIDQRAALDITVGPAHDELQQQLGLVQNMRGAAEETRPHTYYSRVSSRVEGDHAQFIYDLETKMGREAGVKRHAIITVAKRDGRWKVVSFGESEGSAPKRPD